MNKKVIATQDSVYPMLPTLVAPVWLLASFYLTHRRLLTIFLLGFASGLPLALTATTLKAWYTEAGVSLATIGLLGLVDQPYLMKFLWSPLMDRYSLPLGRRRGWMILCQAALVTILTLMAYQNPATTPAQLAVLALCVAFFSASQDIVIDAYRTELLTAEERGLGVAMATTGYRLAMLISGGVALLLAAKFGWRITYLTMAALMAATMLVTLTAPKPSVDAVAPASLYAAIVLPLSEFLQRPKALWLLAFAICYKFGDALAGALTIPFLLRGLHFSLVDVGSINKIVGLVASLSGIFLGGILLRRWNYYHALFFFGIMQALSNLLFALLAWVGKHYGLMVTAVVVENIAAGMGTAGLVALLMALCNVRYTATQYALLSSLTAIGRVFSSACSGFIVESTGWVTFFCLSALAAIPGLIILYFLRREVIAITAHS